MSVPRILRFALAEDVVLIRPEAICANARMDSNSAWMAKSALTEDWDTVTTESSVDDVTRLASRTTLANSK